MNSQICEKVLSSPKLPKYICVHLMKSCPCCETLRVGSTVVSVSTWLLHGNQITVKSVDTCNVCMRSFTINFLICDRADRLLFKSHSSFYTECRRHKGLVLPKTIEHVYIKICKRFIKLDKRAWSRGKLIRRFYQLK